MILLTTIQYNIFEVFLNYLHRSLYKITSLYYTWALYCTPIQQFLLFRQLSLTECTCSRADSITISWWGRFGRICLRQDGDIFWERNVWDSAWQLIVKLAFWLQKTWNLRFTTYFWVFAQITLSSKCSCSYLKNYCKNFLF